MEEKTERSAPSVRPQEPGEEVMNAVTHGLGAALGVVGTVLLWRRASALGGSVHMISTALFGGSMILLYLISCLYHALPAGRAKRTMQVLDHCSIFLLIFGTYIPLALVIVGGSLGWKLFGIVAGCTMVGIFLNLMDMHRWKRLSQILYIVMGWMGLIVLPALIRNLSHMGFFFLVFGGVCYTVGVYFYRHKEKRYWHGIWHLFVLAGTLCHFYTVYTNCCF